MRCLVVASVLALVCVSPVQTQVLPTLMSTNICADTLALSLADPAQIVSLSRQSRDAQRFSMAEQAKAFPVNDASAEDVVHLQPQLVLASRRWNARHQTALLKRYGTKIVTIPFPTDWEGIFSSTLKVGHAMGRDAAANVLVNKLKIRLNALQVVQRPWNVLYLRPNGGSAGVKTHVDAVLTAAGFRNHATALGLTGWGRIDLERILVNPPDVLVTPALANDMAYARSALGRHPQMRRLMEQVPVVGLAHNDWGCSNWQLIEAAESLAAQVDALQLPLPRVSIVTGERGEN